MRRKLEIDDSRIMRESPEVQEAFYRLLNEQQPEKPKGLTGLPFRILERDNGESARDNFRANSNTSQTSLDVTAISPKLKRPDR